MKRDLDLNLCIIQECKEQMSPKQIEWLADEAMKILNYKNKGLKKEKKN